MLAWVVVFFLVKKEPERKVFFLTKSVVGLPIFYGERRRFVPCRDGGGVR